MDRTLKLWEGVLATLTVIFFVGGFVMNVLSKQENHEQRIQNVEKSTDRVDQKLDKLSDKMTEMMTVILNKQDRKK